MEFHVAGYHRCCEFSVCSSASAAAPDGLGNIVNLREMLCWMQEGGPL